MNNKMKKLVVVPIATAILATSGITSIVSAQNNSDINKVIESINQTLPDKPKIEVSTGVEIDPNINTKTESIVSVIVQLKGDPMALTNKDTKSFSKPNESIKQEHEKFKDFISKLPQTQNNKDSIKILNEYDTVFNGIAINLPGKDVEKLIESNLVKSIYKNETVQLELPKQNEKQKNTEVAPFMFDSVGDIGVDKLHEDGIKGKGVKVGVLDTGVDYNHPDLKDNYKGGYDFVDNDNDPMETTPEQWKESGQPEFNRGGSSYYTSHGTHVSGTIAGNGKNDSEFSVVGVAPESDLYVYRVLGPYGSGSTSNIMAAIDKAVKDGMDVINLSLGSIGGDPFDPLTIACNNATTAGVTTVLANGNSGPDEFTVSTPAVSPLSISVGASTTGITLDLYDIKLGESKVEGQTFAKSFDSSIEDFKNLEIVDCGNGYEGEYIGKDVKGKIVLAERGVSSFSDKIATAKENGAKYIIIYNNMSGEIPYYIGESNKYIPAIGLSKEEGTLLKNEIKKGNNKLELIKTGKTKTEKDLLGDFSSKGPTPDSFEIKPDIAAPGVSIFSTYPEFINNPDENETDYNSAYSRISGTSMAAPHVAGAAALLKSENQNYTPSDIKLALMNTADDLKLEYGVNEVGSGRINVYEAANQGVVIKNQQTSKTLDNDSQISEIEHDTGSISFGKVIRDGKDKKMTDELIIKNNTNKTNTFNVSVEYIKPSSTHTGLDAKANGVKLEVKETATASKNKETKLGLNLTIPKEAQRGLYQGYIHLESTRNKNEKYQIPFSVSYMDEGIASVEHEREGNSTKYFGLFVPEIPTIMEINSNMKEIFVFVEDVNGKIIGLANYGEIYSFPLNVPVRLDLYSGMMLPIDENGNLTPEWTPMNEGKYNIRYVMRDASGKVFEKSHDTWVDNTPPEITYDELQPGIYELTEKVSNVNIRGKSFDAGIENTILDQSWTNLYKYDPNWYQTLEMHIPEIDGSFNVRHTVDLSNKDVDHLGFTGIDIFGAGDLREREDFYFIKEGTQYVSNSFDKRVLKPNDEVNMNVNIANIENFNEGTFTVKSVLNHEILDISFTEEFENSAKEQGYEFEVNYKEVGKTEFERIDEISIKAINKSDKPFVFKGSILDVKFKATGDFFYTNDIYDIREEVKIDKADINGNKIENILNTSFRYDVKPKY